MKKEIRKLNKISTHSYSIIIPKDMIDKYGWREKQKMVIEDKGKGQVVIRDSRK